MGHILSQIRLNLRGYLAALVTGIAFVCADLIERTIIVMLIKLRPSARERILDSWQRRLSRLTLGIIQRVGGARFNVRTGIPWEAGVLVVMNHQSLIDIPIALLSVVGGYANIITRERYRTGIPLVSHMIRLYQHPTVRPRERRATAIRRLRGLAATSSRPIVMFPEGERSRDGEIKPFMTAGLHTMLSARSWRVYAIVVDGLWRSTSVGEFLGSVRGMRVTAEHLGPFDFNHETDDAARFVSDLECHMRAKLDEMRGRDGDHGVEVGKR